MSNGNAYLLDSHALLWWWFDPDRLSGAVRELLSDSATPVLVSAASVWELSLKHQQGKLPELNGVITDIPGLLQADGFEALPISLAHGLRAGGYSQRHQTETVPQLVGGHVEGQPDVPVRGEAGGQAPLERVCGPLPRGVIVQRGPDHSLIGGADGATQLG